MIKIKIVAIFVGVIFLCSCTDAQQINWDFSDKLLLVEGNELLAGSFGDIVMLDGENSRKILITNDRIYDESPFLINDTTVIFLSKRENPKTYGGLTKPSHIYKVRFNKEVELNNEKPEKLSLENFYNPSKLIWAEEEYFIIADFTRNHDLDYEIFKSDYYESRIDTISGKNGIVDPQTFFKIDNEKKIKRFVLTEFYSSTVYVYSELNDKPLKPLINKNDDHLGKLRKSNCEAGDFKTENEFFINCHNYSDKKSKMFLYDVQNDSLTTIFQSDSLTLGPALYIGSKIYFISDHYYNENDENIWQFDLIEMSLKRITNSITKKDGLRVY
jgi:hypothetical protein